MNTFANDILREQSDYGTADYVVGEACKAAADMNNALKSSSPALSDFATRIQEKFLALENKTFAFHHYIESGAMTVSELSQLYIRAFAQNAKGNVNAAVQTQHEQEAIAILAALQSFNETAHACRKFAYKDNIQYPEEVSAFIAAHSTMENTLRDLSHQRQAPTTYQSRLSTSHHSGRGAA